uniref:Uncharacterized protein n=1 Tax=Molossus molossus TaxID=27622 RepID=A0A7J8FYE3_MOLMO|nr:hypothetical protein HJG59_008171 [Molossus molossus]
MMLEAAPNSKVFQELSLVQGMPLGELPSSVGLLVAASFSVGSCWFSVIMVMGHSPSNCINRQTSQVLWRLRAHSEHHPRGPFQLGLCRDLYWQRRETLSQTTPSQPLLGGSVGWSVTPYTKRLWV